MRSWGRALAFSVLIVLALMVTSAVPTVQAAPGDSSVQVFYQDFEGGWPLSWTASDDLPQNGTDTWGLSDYRTHQGSESAWCAQAGTDDLGQQNAATHLYDRYMSSNLLIPLGNRDGYSSLTLRFWYWADLGTGDRITLYDWHDGTGSPLWSGPYPESEGWEQAVVSVPVSCTELNFLFYSDPYLDAGGDQGVYIDDVELVGVDVTAPTSSVNALSAFTTAGVFGVAASTADPGGSGVSYVELYYAHGGSTAFSKYTTDANPSGQWSPGYIAFDTSLTGGDGRYDFYSVATDRAGNAEAVPSSGDTGTFVDTVAPVTVATVSGMKGSGGWYVSSVVVTLTAQLDANEVSMEYRLDGGQWIEYTDPFTVSAQGDNIAFFRGVDAAGNHEQEKTVDVLIDRVPPTVSMGIVNGTEFHTPSPSLSWSVNDAMSGISKLEVRLDDDDYTEVPVDRRMMDADNLTEGNHVLWVKAYDHAGNAKESSISFVIDNSTESGLFGNLWLDAESLLIPAILVILAVIALAAVTLYRSDWLHKNKRKKEKKAAGGKPDEVELPPRENMNKTIFVPGDKNMKATKICPKCDHMYLATEPGCPYCGASRSAAPRKEGLLGGLREALAISRAPRAPDYGKDWSAGVAPEEASSERPEPAGPSNEGSPEEPGGTKEPSGTQPQEPSKDDARDVAYRLIRLRRRPKAP
jgi:hypothetical protein